MTGKMNEFNIPEKFKISLRIKKRTYYGYLILVLILIENPPDNYPFIYTRISST